MLPTGWAHPTLSEVRVDRSTGIVPSNAPEARFELYSVPAHPTGVPERVLGREVGSNKQTVEPGTVLLCKINPRINRVWVVGSYSPDTKIASTEWISFFPIDGVDPRYLASFLRRDDVRTFLAANVSGVGGSLMRVRPATVEKLRFPLAPLPEQRRIVAAIEEHLSRVDAGAEALERAKKELARYRASVLKAACEGRLVPTEAALARVEGRSFEPASELLARIFTERRARWDRKKKYAEPAAPDTSSLPALPEGWVWVTVEQLSVGHARNGLSIKGSDSPPGVAALKLDAMTSRGLDFRAIRYLPIAWDEVSDLEVQAGDFFVSRGSGSKTLVGRASVAPQPPGRFIFPDTMIRVRLHADVQAWLREMWGSTFLRAQIENAAKTTAGIWKISQQDIAEFVVPLPPLAEQHRIVAEAERRLSIADEVAASVDSALARAARLRQAILKRAFEGKLVPQDPNDEPASVLLERIRTERERAAAKPAPRKRRRA